MFEQVIINSGYSLRIIQTCENLFCGHLYVICKQLFVNET